MTQTDQTSRGFVKGKIGHPILDRVLDGANSFLASPQGKEWAHLLQTRWSKTMAHPYTVLMLCRFARLVNWVSAVPLPDRLQRAVVLLESIARAQCFSRERRFLNNLLMALPIGFALTKAFDWLKSKIGVA